jgi:GNAT superfamily N-acetyltransferase
MKQIRVRLANEADIPALSELLSLLFEQEAEFTPDRERQMRGLRMIVAQPDIGQIFCAVEGERIVGMVSTLFTVSTVEGGRAAWMEDLIVHPDQRGKGIGISLLREAISRARVVGCTRITLLTDPANDRAHRLYQRLGFKHSPMTPMRLHL